MEILSPYYLRARNISKINLNTLHMKTLRLLLLASLILMMGNPAFCQTRRGSSKARKTTVTKTPSARLQQQICQLLFFSTTKLAATKLTSHLRLPMHQAKASE